MTNLPSGLWVRGILGRNSPSIEGQQRTAWTSILLELSKWMVLAMTIIGASDRHGSSQSMIAIGNLTKLSKSWKALCMMLYAANDRLWNTRWALCILHHRYRRETNDFEINVFFVCHLQLSDIKTINWLSNQNRKKEKKIEWLCLMLLDAISIRYSSIMDRLLRKGSSHWCKDANCMNPFYLLISWFTQKKKHTPSLASRCQCSCDCSSASQNSANTRAVWYLDKPTINTIKNSLWLSVSIIFSLK